MVCYLTILSSTRRAALPVLDICYGLFRGARVGPAALIRILHSNRTRSEAAIS